MALLWWSLAGLSGVTTITPGSQSLVLPLAEPVVADDDWPGWQGGARQGVAPTANPPGQWSLPQNSDPRGTLEQASAPCVIGDAIFLTRRRPSQGETWLTCLDRATGALRWRISLGRERDVEGMLPTPASDGTRVFVSSSQQGELVVSAFNLQGQRLWSQATGPIGRAVGPGQSPLIAGALVYVAIDQKAPPWQWNGVGGYVAALHRQTGQIVWRTPRVGAEGSATPIVGTLAGRRQLVLPSRNSVRAYDADTGRELWRVRWSARVNIAAVVSDDEHVYATAAGAERETLCIRADGTGDVDDTHVAWRVRFAGSGASPVLAGNQLIIVSEEGGVTALDRGQGRVVWQQRLPGHFTAAPLLAGSRLYCLDHTGDVFVLDVQQQGHAVGHSRTDRAHGLAIAGDRLLFTSSSGVSMISASGPTRITHDDLTIPARR
ncbi:MAG TPA: PQQ-binding-like beta-propeller repeat protein [Planctomycetaceae bacterium]|nr:PQQ-binding-like beta-propeller repeat protein [Planctomycetaceae bacterium]